MAVHLLVERFAEKDPAAREAVALLAELRRLGHWGRIYAEKRSRSLQALSRPAKELAPRHEDWVLSIQRGKRFDQLSCRKALVAPGFSVEATVGRAERTAPRGPRPRVAIVVQRYGEALGGAEAHARAIAQRMASDWDVTVLTSCAKDHLTWKNALPAGESRDGPVRVLRFPTERTRRMRVFNWFSRRVFKGTVDRLTEERWLAEQGPLAPGLLEHIAQAGAYDGYVFFTALYLTTAWGLPLVADRALLVPTVHDEPAMRLSVYRDAIERARALMCNTPEEEALIRQLFPNAARSRVVGVGVDLTRGSTERFKADRPYLLYVGRIEKGKDLPELLRFHAAAADAPRLLLAGHASMRVRGRRVRMLGRIDEGTKRDAIAGAEAVVVPARLESLSLVALEAFAQGTPIIANGRSEVLAGQCRRSGAGLTYTDTKSFAEAVREVRARRAELGAHGETFARENSWANVSRAYREEMEAIAYRTQTPAS